MIDLRSFRPSNQPFPVEGNTRFATRSAWPHAYTDQKRADKRAERTSKVLCARGLVALASQRELEEAPGS